MQGVEGDKAFHALRVWVIFTFLEQKRSFYVDVWMDKRIY